MFLVEPVEATWSECCRLYRAFLKRVTVSEVDSEEHTVCYACASQPILGFRNPAIDFEPINFQVQYYVQSRKGMDCVPPNGLSYDRALSNAFQNVYSHYREWKPDMFVACIISGLLGNYKGVYVLIKTYFRTTRV